MKVLFLGPAASADADLLRELSLSGMTVTVCETVDDATACFASESIPVVLAKLGVRGLRDSGETL